MLADLEERFHENTARRNLSAFEELISIGTLAAQFPDLTQSQIAARLGVVQADVSLGIACLYHRKKLEKEIDTVTASKRYFRSLLPKLKRGDPLGPCPYAPDLKPDTQMWNVRGIVCKSLWVSWIPRSRLTARGSISSIWRQCWLIWRVS